MTSEKRTTPSPGQLRQHLALPYPGAALEPLAFPAIRSFATLWPGQLTVERAFDREAKSALDLKRP